MEKVWEELKKVESEAERIRSESAKASSKMVEMAAREADIIINKSAEYAMEEGQELRDAAVAEANKERDLMLEANASFVKKLAATAKTRLEDAVEIVFEVVLGKKPFE